MLPTVSDEAALVAFLATPAADAALAALADRLGMERLTRPARGSALIGLGEREVLKVMAPMDAALSETEALCLAALDGRLPVATPRLLDAGAVDGWRWIRMTRLPGRELADRWAELAPADRLALATQLGELLAALHELPAPEGVPRVNWPAWRADRLQDLEERQRARGCPEALVDGLAAYVAAADPTAGATGWLHTEVMREHLLVDESAGGWRLTGVFDFEPSWVAPRDYEFASVGLFVSAGDRAVLGEVLRAYGRRITPDRLFAMAMLHRYANLGWYHRRLGGPLAPAVHATLADAWFGAA